MSENITSLDNKLIKFNNNNQLINSIY
jgi:hypothetical protein